MGLVYPAPLLHQDKTWFTTTLAQRDILQKLQEKHSKNFKTLVLSNADITLPKPKAG